MGTDLGQIWFLLFTSLDADSNFLSRIHLSFSFDPFVIEDFWLHQNYVLERLRSIELERTENQIGRYFLEQDVRFFPSHIRCSY